MARFSNLKFLLICLLLMVVVLSIKVLNCSSKVRQYPKVDDPSIRFDETDNWYNHTLAVIIPFRDRFEELQEFAPHIHQFLNQQRIPHNIYVVNQVDNYRFNRAALINIGFLFSKNDCDYIVMHDVDLLPQNIQLLYDYPEKGPYHLSSPEYHPLYHYKTYIGGVLMMTNTHFTLCNGMSNMFWGWGREDDELYVRFKKHNLKLHRPSGLTTGYETFKHVHDRRIRPRDYNRNDYRNKMKLKDGGKTGFSNVAYQLLSTRSVTIDEAPVKVINVGLECNESETPWCSKQPTTNPSKISKQ